MCIKEIWVESNTDFSYKDVTTFAEKNKSTKPIKSFYTHSLSVRSFMEQASNFLTNMTHF